MKGSQEENRRLIQRYPFLLPRNRWTDQAVEDFDDTWTELDCLPVGWRIAFGEEMLEELREILLKGDYLQDYRITQVKEKYGSLRWYCNGYPKAIMKEMMDWEAKYAAKSAYTCIQCGKPATHITTGYIEPYCSECIRKVVQDPSQCPSPEEWYQR